MGIFILSPPNEPTRFDLMSHLLHNLEKQAVQPHSSDLRHEGSHLLPGSGNSETCSTFLWS